MNKKTKYRLKNNKGFTIIELLVTVSIFAILVAIAVPRFNGFVQKAEVAHIQSDVRSIEDSIERDTVLEISSYEDWGESKANKNELKSNASNGKIFSTKGVISKDDILESVEYKTVPNNILMDVNSSLPGTFYSNSMGGVLYSKSKVSQSSYSDKEIDDFIEKESDVIPVSSYEDLMAIGSGGKHTFAKGTKWETERTTHISDKRFYMQVNDIDLSGKSYTPIGDSSWAFKGSYNGGNFTISNLSSIRPDKPFSGMFGKLYGSTIKDLVLENVNVEADYSGGGLAGYVESDEETIISNVHVTGKVRSGDNTGGLVGYSGVAKISDVSLDVEIEGGNIGGISGYIGGVVGRDSTDQNPYITNSHIKILLIVDEKHNNVGGVAGALNGKISNTIVDVTLKGGASNVGGMTGLLRGTGEISNSSSISNISSSASSVGGISGTVNKGATIRNTSSIVDIETSSSNVGGIIGNNYGSVINSHSNGFVSGMYDVGGVVGDNKGIVRNTYSSSRLTKKSSSRNTIGGIVGKQDVVAEDIISSYYNIDISGDIGSAAGEDSSGAIGKSSDDLYKKETYKGWDFDSTWKIEEGKSKPTLRR